MQHGTSQPEPQRYADERRTATARGARVTAACALALIPVFAYLDTVLFPAHASQLLVWRLASFCIALAVLGLLLAPAGRRFPLLLGVVAPIAIGMNINVVTLVVGREANPYYAGLVIVLFGASVFLPWTPAAALGVSTVFIGSYAAAMLATGPITNLPHFTSHLVLIGSAAVLVVLGAAVKERLRRREFQSRMALDAHARRHEAVARLGQLALGGTGPHDLMERAVALVPEMLGFELAAVLELRADGKSLLLRSGAGWEPGLVGHARVPLEAHSQARHVLEHGPVFTDALGAETRFAPIPFLLPHRAVSGICVPIAGRESPVGILVAYTAQPRRCIPPEVECLESLAGVLTTAILREEAERALASDAHRSAALADVGRDLISSLETPVLLERLCQRTAEVLGTDHSVTWLLDPAERVYLPISAQGLPPDKWEALRAVRLPAASIGLILERLGRDELVDLTPTSHEHPVAAQIVKHLGITRSLLLPLRRGGEIIGIQANGYRGRTEPFTLAQQQLGRGIAQLASMALSNARLVEELERASSLKSEFVSTMSHELRTPLNVIVGYLDILADDLKENAQSTLLGRARTASLELLEMIDATLNLNRIAAGQDPPVLAVVRIDELWDELQSDFAAIKRKTAATLRWEPPGDVLVRTDRRKLKIIVKNLVGNALKFTPAGEVVASCKTAGNDCIFTVRDTGVGISAAHLPHIFDMFRQVDSSDARSYAGAGLGLYIVKSLLTQLGGEVSVESTLGRGSTFRVRLPRDNAAAYETDVPLAVIEHASALGAESPMDAEVDRSADLASAERQLAQVAAKAATTLDVAGAATLPAERRKRIVFADDLELNRHLLRRFLAREMPEVECFEACNGVEALELIKAHKPDLVLLDLRMPEMDGWQAARRIRELENGRDIPIIALSVTASAGAEAYAIHAGCNEFVTKPVSDYSTLMARLTHWLRPEGDEQRHGPGDAEICVLCRQPLPSVFRRGRDAHREQAAS